MKKGQGFVRAVLFNVFNRAAAIRVNKTVLTRNDSTGVPGVQSVHRYAGAGGALRIRVGFRPADQPLRLPGVEGILVLVRDQIC